MCVVPIFKNVCNPRQTLDQYSRALRNGNGPLHFDGVSHLSTNLKGAGIGFYFSGTIYLDMSTRVTVVYGFRSQS
jgi:hypothetical protein